MQGSFFEWISKIDFLSWDALNAIGQAVGAMGTLLAVLVALKQTKEARKQAIEERNRADRLGAREEAEEAKKPSARINFVMGNEGEIQIILTNLKPIPLYIIKAEVTVRKNMINAFPDSEGVFSCARHAHML